MNAFYYLTHLIGIILSVCYMIWIVPKYKLDRLKTILCTLCALATGTIIMKLAYFFVEGSFGGQNIIRSYVFVPLIGLFWSKIFKIPTKLFFDATALTGVIPLVTAKIGCQYVGCCQSWWQVDWGIYNRFQQAKLFPLQLVECLATLAVVVVITLIAIKKKYDTKGLQMPIMFIIYGTTRFLLEFLKNNKKLFLNLSELSLWALALLLEGIIWLLVYKIKKEKKGAS